MNRASPIDLRKAAEVANTFLKAGILFVCVPVLDEADHAALVEQSGRRLDQMAQEAEAQS
jgi:hypothetical protein